MTIGIIVAMSKERDLLLPLLSAVVTERQGVQEFHRGTLGAHTIVVHQCGIGKVNAAMGAMALVERYAPQVVINTGVAGGADAMVNVMDVVVGARVAYHDVWCGPESVLGAVQGLPLYYEGEASLIARLPQRPDIHRGLICSGDQFIDTRAAVDKIKTDFPDALAVDMESGAIAQVCYRLGVPFLSMRVISDSPGASHNNTAQYTDFWADAPLHTFELVRSLLEQL